MTKPLGSAPTPREDRSASRSFFGQPIVVRVRDLNWQPPAPAPAEETWVSSLLGEDLPENRGTESLLDGLGDSDTGVTSAPSSATPAAATAPVADRAASETSAHAPTTPSYLHRPAPSRDQRRHLAISGQWLNRLYMGGMAVSLLVASYWVLTSGGTGEEATDKVPEDLFADTSLEEAPPWSGLEPSLTPHEAITVEPPESNVPQMASLPARASTAMPQNPAELELTTIHPPYSSAPAAPPTGLNPASSASSVSTGGLPPKNDEPIWSYGPSSTADSLAGDYETPNSSEGVPTGNNLPAFDPNPAGQTAASSADGTLEHRTGYPSTVSNEPTTEHWMLNNDREFTERQNSRSPQDAESHQYTQVIHGNPAGESMPQIHSPPQMAESTPGHHPAQGNMEFGFGPHGDPYAAPYSQQDSVPRSASRAGLTGDIETFSGTR